MRKKFDLIVFLFLLLSPIIDVLTGLGVRYDFFLSIGVVIRGIMLLLALIYLYINRKEKSSIIIVGIYALVELLYLYFYLNSNLFTEVKNMIIIFYLPLMILFFSYYENKKINLSLMLKINVLYLLVIVVPYFLGIGFNTYSGLDGKSSYLGLFLDGNELSALLLLLSPLSIYYLLQEKNYSYLICFILLHLIGTLIIGTKVLLLGTFIVALYFIINSLKKLDKKKRNIVIIGTISFIVLGIILLPFTPVYKNLTVSLDYYNVSSIKDVFKYEFIDNIIFSKRLSFSSKIFSIYSDSFIKIMCGIGREAIILIKDVEIDLLDIMYSIGVVGLIVYLYTFKNKFLKLKGVYKFTFILLFIISFFSGHVLIKPMVATFMAALFLLNNSKENI